MSASDTARWLDTARSLARAAGATVREARKSSMTIHSKSGSSDLVTSADINSQRIICDGLKDAYPQHRRIGEEDSTPYEALDSRPTWIIDAIDGTTNFVSGLQDVGICIALAVDAVVVVGVVYNPFLDEMFEARRGAGAFLNQVPIRSSQCAALEDALVISEWGYDRTPEGVDKMLAGNRRLLVANVRGIRQLGSGALDMCYVAMGRADAVYCGVAGEAWCIWDYAAASLIAEEAGASLSTLQKAPFYITSKSMVCSAPALIDRLIDVVVET